MADSTLQDLTATTAPAASDVLYIVVDPSGTPADRKITLSSLFGAGVTAAKFLSLSVPGGGSNSEIFGLGAAAAGAQSVAVGRSASASGASAVAFGHNASASNTGNVAIGQGASAIGDGGGQAVAIGQGATAAKWRGTAVGWEAQADEISSTAIGRRAHARGVHSVAIGRGSRALDGVGIGFGGGHLYIGSGEAHRYVDLDGSTVDLEPETRPSYVHAVDAYDETETPNTSVGGGDLVLCGGRSTGTAAGGSVILATAAAGGVDNNTKNALVDRVEVFSNGDVEVLTAGAGIIVRSPNGTRYRIGVSDAGVLAATAL